MKRWIWIGIVAAGMAAACSSRQKPFTEWWASSKYEDYVPPTATPVASGTQLLTYRAAVAGTVYVIDVSESVQIKEATVPHALGSAFVRKGGVAQFDPQTGEISANNQSGVKIENVQAGHKFELRFDPVTNPNEK